MLFVLLFSLIVGAIPIIPPLELNRSKFAFTARTAGSDPELLVNIVLMFTASPSVPALKRFKVNPSKTAAPLFRTFFNLSFKDRFDLSLATMDIVETNPEVKLISVYKS